MVQVNSSKLNLRLRFFKKGSLQYISHLDLVRTVNKIIVRAGLPLWYTEGFNPKPKMVFAAPLSIGTESVCEFLDVRLNTPMDPAEAMERLNRNMTHEMQVTEAYYPTRPFTDLRWMSYSMTVNTLGASATLAEQCENLLNAPTVTVMKKTKSGERDVDIRPLIHSAKVSFDGEALRINAILSADQAQFLNPEYLIKALRAGCGILSSPNLLEESYSIMREQAFTADMKVFS